MKKLFYQFILLITVSLFLVACNALGRIVEFSVENEIHHQEAMAARAAQAEAQAQAPPVIREQGVVIDGIRWATRNVETPGTFVENPESIGMFYQWNRLQAWAATGSVTDWDNSYYRGFNNRIWARENDPCPVGWRIPTQAELESLARATNTWIDRDGVRGRIFGTAPNQIFLPVAGSRESRNGGLRGERIDGIYWSSTGRGGSTAANLRFSPGGNVQVGSQHHAFGASIRCVAEH